MKLPDAIDRVRASTVQINIDLHPSPRQLLTPVLGTGFLVSEEGWVVTARHVVEAAQELTGSPAPSVVGVHVGVSYAGPAIDSPGMQMRASFVKVDSVVVAESVEDDLALLQLGRGLQDLFGNLRVGPDAMPAPKPRAVTLSTTRPREGVPIAVSGYPLQEPSLVTTAGVLASSWAMENMHKGRFADRYLADLTANPGNSGGPAYLTDTAEVIGVLVAGRLVPIHGLPPDAPALMTPANLSVLVPAKAVAIMLDQADVEWTHPRAPTAPKSRRPKR